MTGATPPSPGVPPPLRLAADGWSVDILDQTRLPHQASVVRLTTLDHAVEAIRSMQVRGAPLIGITAAYGLCLALMTDDSDQAVEDARDLLLATRPTAVNLRYALDLVAGAARAAGRGGRVSAAYAAATDLAAREVASCRAIGEHGLGLLRDIAAARNGEPVRVLTHCNAGWLATLAWGTALAPVYLAREEGLPVHVWVDETRPRNQGWLTAWELHQGGVPHTVITDTMAGHLLQRGEVDLVLVGTDRTTRKGDVCNKIGTWPLALAARQAGVPFYAAVPGSSVDWELTDWRVIPIEERDHGEVEWVAGQTQDGTTLRIRPGSGVHQVRNPAFDVTPARFLTGLITERGICRASRNGLLSLYPERRR